MQMTKSQIFPVSRTTIFTRDIKKSLLFWQKLMGLSKVIDAMIPNPGASKILGQKCDFLRVVVLSSSDLEIGNIGIAEIIGGEEKIKSKPIFFDVQYGETCIVIRTKDLKKLLTDIKSFECSIISYPTKLDLPIKEEVWEMFLRDPDGTLINLSHHGPWEE
tara:strand:+ start:497 stop:979 length:483 start_codon:yes stop_codon:yes gene_type:complete